MKTLLWYKRHIPSGVAMSETEQSNRFWQDCVPKSFIYDEYCSDAVETMINVQRKRHKAVTDPEQMEPVFWVAEDCMGSGELSKCKHARRVFTNGRQWRIFALLSLQYVTDLPPKFRGQVDYVFAYRALAEDDREKLYQYFFSGAFSSYGDFLQVLKACTSDYHCLVLDATKPTNKLDEQVFWWKAPPAPEFKAGSKEFWQFHLMNFKDDDEDDDMQDPLANRRHRQLKVKMLK
ncbi:hypothetical protein WJX74_010697 [Apatococcus lobatus]|uniref:Uncharacterized protein n=1 Tax=Apatococcus lobatus TaxID=904363 RepID=A0AAW1R0K6_9CHLO